VQADPDDLVVLIAGHHEALFEVAVEQGLASATMAYNMMDLSALEGVQAFIEKRMPNWVAGRRE